MAETKSLFKLVTGVLVLVTVAACQTTNDEGVETATAIEADTDYYSSYTKATRSKTVHDEFKTRFSITSTFLTTDFRNAMAKRHLELFQESQPVLGEASDKAGFFISAHVSNEDLADLRDERLWNIFVDSPSGPIQPVLIKKLREKEQWKAFFPEVNLWTEEYLVLFDSSFGDSEKLVQKDAVRLMISNRHAKVSFNW